MKKFLLFSIGMFNTAWMTAQFTCATATVLAPGTVLSQTVTGDAPPTACSLGAAGTKGIWYKYTPVTDKSVTINTSSAGSVSDTRMMVFTGNCGALTCLTANDDYSGIYSRVTFNATAGTTYYIAFDNKYSASAFNITLAEGTVVSSRLSFNTVPVTTAGSFNNCVVDMNGDYLDDIVSVVSNTQIVIGYQQPGGSFNNVTYTIPNTTVTPSWSIAAGDYDNNGFNDLMYGSGSGIVFVKANANGTGYTADRKPQSFLTQRTNFVDINKDGKLDAFACDDNAPNRFYMNDGTNLNHYQGGLGDFASGGNYGSIWIDYDNDGDMDLFIAKCSGGGSGPGGNIDELHRNNGNGTFTNVATAANMANAVQTWSSAWGDFDNDGWMDAVVGANSTSNGLTRVMKNNGDGTFKDKSAGSGYDTNTALGREFVAHDFDNDGFLDVMGAGNNIMFGNGDFTFVPNATAYNFNLYDRPVGDLNNDGFLDVQNGNNIMMNAGNTNKWLKVTLKGIQSNRNGIGARVEIYGSWGKQIRDVQSGTGFQNMSTLNVHFGIGQATAITKVVVKWPSGMVDTINNVTPNTTLNVVEGTFLNTKEADATGELFTVYPNPVGDDLNFTASQNFMPSKASIYEMSGRMVLQAKIERNSLSLKELNPGNYMIVVTDKNGKSQTRKITKK